MPAERAGRSYPRSVPDPATLQAALLGLVLGVHHLVLGTAFRLGRVGPNPALGFCFGEVTRTEQAWYAGHRAASVWLLKAAPVTVAAGVAGLLGSAPAASVGVLVGFAVLLPACLDAQRAADATC